MALYRATSASRSVSGVVCTIGGRAVGRGVLVVKTLCFVGAAVALGVGDGLALSVVGAAVVCPEDVLLSGSSVARSEDRPPVGSSEPPQASSSNGRSNARAKIPKKRRGVLISIHSMCLLGRGVGPTLAWLGTRWG